MTANGAIGASGGTASVGAGITSNKGGNGGGGTTNSGGGAGASASGAGANASGPTGGTGVALEETGATEVLQQMATLDCPLGAAVDRAEQPVDLQRELTEE